MYGKLGLNPPPLSIVIFKARRQTVLAAHARVARKAPGAPLAGVRVAAKRLLGGQVRKVVLVRLLLRPRLAQAPVGRARVALVVRHQLLTVVHTAVCRRMHVKTGFGVKTGFRGENG